MFDLGFRGCHFTWSNKNSLIPKARKLDRALVNEAWLDSFPDSHAFFDVPGNSDQSPCLVSVSSAAARRISRFTFFSFFTTYPDYQYSSS